MHKIDGAGATIDGLFTQGDPVSGVPATLVTDDWLNAVQTEIVGVIEGAGIELEKPDNGQLLAAIRSMIVEAIPPAQPPQWFTGDYVLTMRSSPADGWIVCDDGSIGSPTSAATTRANDDCEALYGLLWTFVGDAYAPVSGGRGASAEADWLAGKTIGLTKVLGRSLAVAGSGASLTARQIGEVVGNESHALTAAELPSHVHANTLSDPAHVHANAISDPTHAHGNSLNDPGHNHGHNAQLFNTGSSTGGGGFPAPGPAGATINAAGTGMSINNAAAFTGVSISNVASATGVSISNTAFGGDAAHNIMQPTSFLYAHIRL